MQRLKEREVDILESIVIIDILGILAILDLSDIPGIIYILINIISWIFLEILDIADILDIYLIPKIEYSPFSNIDVIRNLIKKQIKGKFEIFWLNEIRKVKLGKT